MKTDKKLLIVVIITLIVLSIVFIYQWKTELVVEDISFGFNRDRTINVTVASHSNIEIKDVYINGSKVTWYENKYGFKLHEPKQLIIKYNWESGENLTLVIISDNSKVEKKVQTPLLDSNILISNITVLFENKPVAQKTTIVSKDDANWIKVSGMWKLKNEKYFTGKNSQPITDGAGVIVENLTLSNTTIEFKVKPEDSTLKDHIAFALNFRFKDTNNYYYLYSGYNRRNNINDFIIGKKIDGDWTHFKIGSYIWQPGIWYKIKLIVNDNYISGYVNNVKLLETNDIDFKLDKGKIGLSAYGSSADFSDIRITDITGEGDNFTITYNLKRIGLFNFSITPHIAERNLNPSNLTSYTTIYNFTTINYNVSSSIIDQHDSLTLSLPADFIRPPDIIYFPTEPYQNRTFAIRLIAKGWDEEKQEWMFKEFMSPEFTWEDVVEGRAIAADGSRSTE